MLAVIAPLHAVFDFVIECHFGERRFNQNLAAGACPGGSCRLDDAELGRSGEHQERIAVIVGDDAQIPLFAHVGLILPVVALG